MTFYLKYRPQTIKELDSEQVRLALQKIVASVQMPHAFLFSGPRGAGKTSTARILAKVVNCEKFKPDEKQTDFEPCNQCAQCESIAKGNSLDVVEIDAASNRGVEDIRSLRETVKLSPIGARKKVYIIDESHMLTPEASNALLKTLEEPPNHVLFILATTAPEKLLDTIRSRCTTINFTKGERRELINAMKKVVKGEKLDVEGDVLEKISEHVDGSFREAHKIIEQLSFNGQKIKLEDLEKTVTVAADPSILTNLTIKGRAKEALIEIDKIANQGVNLKTYTSQMISIVRKSLLATIGVREDIKFDMSLSEHVLLLRLLARASNSLQKAVIAQLPLEIAIVRYCQGQDGNQGARISGLENESREQDNKAARFRDENRDGKEDENRGKIDNENIRTKGHEDNSRGKKMTGEELDALWPQIMRATKEKNHSAEALLRASHPVSFDGNVFQIEVYYKFHKERLETEQYRSLVEETIATILGAEVKLVCILTETQKRASDLRNVTKPEDSDLAKIAEDIFSSPTERQIH